MRTLVPGYTLVASILIYDSVYRNEPAVMNRLVASGFADDVTFEARRFRLVALSPDVELFGANLELLFGEPKLCCWR